MLSDRDIARELAAGTLLLDPHDPAAVQPASVDVHLGATFATLYRPTGRPLDPREPVQMREHVVPPGEPYVLTPGGFALGATVEVVGLPAHIAGRYEGKSSIARLGVATHVTAGFIDPGFTGSITLELANHSGHSVLLWPGMAIGQVSLTYLNAPAARPYGAERGSHYQGQRGPTASRVHQQVAARGL